MENHSHLQGKTALITGATDGIGRVTAEALAAMGADLFLVGRNPQKTADTARAISEKTANPKVHALVADLSVQSDVRRLADTFRQQRQRLHILVNNAGGIFMQRQSSPDGIEMTLALNHLAYFLLTNLLVDVFVGSAPARIVNVSSGAHVGGKIDFHNLQLTHGYSSFKAYSQSKLANVYFTYELARRLSGSGVSVNCLHPGFVATNFGVSNGGFFKPIFKLFQIGAISPDKGAATSIYLASSPEVEGISGKYFDQKKPVASSKISYDADIARQLWDISLQLTGLPETGQGSAV